MNKIKTILTVSLIFPLPLVFVSCKVNQKNINQDLNKINIPVISNRFKERF